MVLWIGQWSWEKRSDFGPVLMGRQQLRRALGLVAEDPGGWRCHLPKQENPSSRQVVGDQELH